MTKLNVRIRTSLFDALLRQEIAFFTSTRTGEACVPYSAMPTCLALTALRATPCDALMLLDCLLTAADEARVVLLQT